MLCIVCFYDSLMACKFLLLKFHFFFFLIIGRKKLNIFQSFNLFAKFQPREKFLWLSYKPLKIGVYNGNTDTTLTLVALAVLYNIH